MYTFIGLAILNLFVWAFVSSFNKKEAEKVASKAQAEVAAKELKRIHDKHDEIGQGAKKLTAEKESAEWLASQSDEPKYFVKVVTRTGEIYKSEIFEPTSSVYEEHMYSLPNYFTVSKYSSIAQAKDCIITSVHTHLGYRHKETNRFIPYHEIVYMEAVEA